MAKYYETPIRWLDGTSSEGRGLGNNAAWRCKCGETLLATTRYQQPRCPGCHRVFKAKRGEAPQYISGIDEQA